MGCSCGGGHIDFLLSSCLWGKAKARRTLSGVTSSCVRGGGSQGFGTLQDCMMIRFVSVPTATKKERHPQSCSRKRGTIVHGVCLQQYGHGKSSRRSVASISRTTLIGTGCGCLAPKYQQDRKTISTTTATVTPAATQSVTSVEAAGAQSTASYLLRRRHRRGHGHSEA